jgi:hemerythrin-like domain-containing protein
MKPIGPLMREHRLIERMVGLLEKQQGRMKEVREVDVTFLMVAVDFFRTYADRTHHGKEEDILFRELGRKQLAPGLGRIMNELIEEHVWARKTVAYLVQARESYIQGEPDSLNEITRVIKELVLFYPAHIRKEDKHFFYPILDYLDKPEQNRMLEEFWEFDRKLIHEKYQNIVEEIERGGKPAS